MARKPTTATPKPAAASAAAVRRVAGAKTAAERAAAEKAEAERTAEAGGVVEETAAADPAATRSAEEARAGAPETVERQEAESKAGVSGIVGAAEANPRPAAGPDAASAAASARFAAAEAVGVKRPLVLDGGSAPAERVAALPLSDYLSVLRREIARAGAEAADEGDVPLVSLAEAEISLACVAVAIENDRLIVDPTWKTLSAAPEGAVQRLKLRMIDADMAATLREKG